MEDIDSKLDRLAEGQQAGFSYLDKKIDTVDNKVDGLHKEMNYKFDVVFDELHLIRNELKEKVSREEFLVLEKRVAHVEKKLSHSSK